MPTWKEKLEIAAEHICADCNHIVEQGYVLCGCCMRGRCYKASPTAIEAKNILSKLALDADNDTKFSPSR